MKTNPAVLLPTAALGSPGAPMLDLLRGQFLTGMAFDWICCPKPAGIKVATQTHAARRNITEPSLENLERGHLAFMQRSPSSLGFALLGLTEHKQHPGTEQWKSGVSTCFIRCLANPDSALVHCETVLFVVGPHSDDLYHPRFLEDLIHQAVLNVDSA